MTITGATATMTDWAHRWDAAIPSAVLSGINGDAAHQTDPGKHLSRSDNIARWGASCWPVVHPKDKQGPSDKACAIDMNMNREDQNVVHNRFVNVWRNRAADPRAQYLYAFNGWNGSGQPMRYNVANGATSVTDSSHTWHEHVETYYAYVNDPKMVDAMMSIIKGESVATYLGRTVKAEMALELGTLIGGDTGFPARRLDWHFQDIQNFRGYAWGETHKAAQPPKNAPIRALESIPTILATVDQMAKEIQELRQMVALLSDSKPPTAPATPK